LRETAELERLRRMYGTLRGVNLAILRAESVEQLLEEVCRVAVERGGLKFAWAGRVAGRTLKPVCSYGSPPSPGRRPPAGMPAALSAVRSGRVVLGEPGERRGEIRCAAVPVELEGRVAAALTLCSSEPRTLEEFRDLLEQLRRDLSLGLEHLQLHSELRSGRERFRKFSAALLELSRMDFTTLEEVLRRTARLAAESLGVDRVSIWLLEREGAELVCRYAHSRTPGRGIEGKVLRLAEFPAFFSALEESRIVAVGDASSDRRTQWLGEVAPGRGSAVMCVPLRRQGRLAGMMCHEHGSPREWTLEEQEFATSVADLVSLAFEHSERRRMMKKAGELALFPAKNPNPVFKVTREGEIVYHNPAVLNYISTPGEVEQLLPENFAELVRRACETGRSIRTEHRFGDSYLHYTIHPVSADAAHIYGKEITEVKRAEEKLRRYARELERSQRALLNILEDEQEAARKLEEAYRELKTLDQLKSDIIANVSHELRTPMTIAKGFAELALEEEDEEERRREIQRVIRALENQNAIIGNLITVAEASRERLKLQVSPFRVEELISAVVRKKEEELQARELSLEVKVEDCVLEGDFKRLMHALLNILDNAIKFNRPGGKVGIEVRRSGSRVLITVTDTGIGIARDVMPKIFDPLYQADASARRKYGGTGMGLAVARIVVEAHGGEIYASSSPGEGSRFTVLLPLRRGAEDEEGAGG